MSFWDWLFGTESDSSGWDAADSQRWENYQYGQSDSRRQVRRTWHGAREDARSDPRSSDPNDVAYTGDWGKS